MMQKYQYNNKGFTLIEIMIAITILAVISLLTATSMQNTIQLKRKIQKKIDSGSEIRSTLKVIKKDMQTAFHYNNYNLEILTAIRREIILEKQRKAGKDTTNKTTPPKTTKPKTTDNGKVSTESIIADYINQYKEQKAKTHFIGEKDSLHFTSLNHVRRFKDAQESNMMEVGFYTENCRSLLKADKRSQCLWRRSTPFLDEKTDEGGNAAVLLENIVKIEFSYYDSKTEDWLSRWLSNEDGSRSTRNRFPDAIKMHLEIEVDGQTRKEDLVVALFFTNNEEPKKTEQGNEANETTQK